MANEIDVYIGRRLRRRRRLLGLTQLRLGEAIGMRFQQIQKYECGANRMSAERVYQMARALRVPTSYFFEGLPDPMAGPTLAANDEPLANNEIMGHEETIELVRAYYQLGERPRRRLLDLAKALREEAPSAA